MHNKHIRGKPLLIVANKQDLDESLDVIDITYFFRVDELCNLLGTPCLIVPCGQFDHAELSNGFAWLIDNVAENYKTLKNRMRFNVLSSPIKRFRRQRTSVPRKVRKIVDSCEISGMWWLGQRSAYYQILKRFFFI